VGPDLVKIHTEATVSHLLKRSDQQQMDGKSQVTTFKIICISTNATKELHVSVLEKFISTFYGIRRYGTHYKLNPTNFVVHIVYFIELLTRKYQQ
jgi:hypothetical protein